MTPPTWIDYADDVWGFDTVYLWLWNTTGERGTYLGSTNPIGAITPLHGFGSRLVTKPTIEATWSRDVMPPGEVVTARGAIATLPDGTVVWFGAFNPVMVRDGDLTVNLPSDFWTQDFAHLYAPDAFGRLNQKADTTP